jgi:hypothetical protein
MLYVNAYKDELWLLYYVIDTDQLNVSLFEMKD